MWKQLTEIDDQIDTIKWATSAEKAISRLEDVPMQGRSKLIAQLLNLLLLKVFFWCGMFGPVLVMPFNCSSLIEVSLPQRISSAQWPSAASASVQSASSASSVLQCHYFLLSTKWLVWASSTRAPNSESAESIASCSPKRASCAVEQWSSIGVLLSCSVLSCLARCVLFVLA